MIYTQENGEKPHFGPNSGQLSLNSAHQSPPSKICLRQSLEIMVSYHCTISEKRASNNKMIYEICSYYKIKN